MTTPATGVHAWHVECAPHAGRARSVLIVDYVTAALACMGTTAVAAPLSRNLDLANVVMLYPLTVLLVAFRLDRGPAIVSAFLCVALFDFFLVPPYYTFAVADVQYLLTLAVMLIVALVTGHLTAGLKQHAEDTAQREERTRALYDMARILTGARTITEVEETVSSFTSSVTGTTAVLLLYDEQGSLAPVTAGTDKRALDVAMANIAGDSAGLTDIDAPYPVRYQPLVTPSRKYGVLAFVAPRDDSTPLSQHVELLQAVTSLVAISVDRIRSEETAKRHVAQPATDALRHSHYALLARELRYATEAVGALKQAVHDAGSDDALPRDWPHVAASLEAAARQLSVSVEKVKAFENNHAAR